MKKTVLSLRHDYETMKREHDIKPIKTEPPFSEGTFELVKLDEQLRNTIIKGNSHLIHDTLFQVLAAGIEPLNILDIVTDVMNAIGQLYAAQQIFIADLWMAARCVDLIKNVIEPLITANGLTTDKKKIVLGTVAGDVHSIGPKIVELFLEGAGYEVINLGVDVTTKRFLQAVETYRPAFVGLSAWLDTTATISLKQTIQALIPLREHYHFKIIVGGLAVTRKFAQEIGADAYGKNAQEAVQAINQLQDGHYRWEACAEVGARSRTTP